MRTGWSKTRVVLTTIRSLTAFLASVVGIAAGLGWLPAGGSGDTPANVSVLIESGQGDRVRGFFTAKGYVVTYNADFLQAGATAAWTVDGKTNRAPVALVQRGTPESQAALLQLVGMEPPEVRAKTRPVEDLKQSEPVRFIAAPGQERMGEVIDPARQVPDFPFVEGYRDTLRLLETTAIGVQSGDAGMPVTDSEGRIVGMMIALTDVHAYSIPITVLIGQFPQAF